MTTCEWCGKLMRPGDLVHGIKHGSLSNSGFIPARDAAVTVLCNYCSRKIYNLVYASLDGKKLAYPAIFRTYEQLTTIMKNGYQVIQAISRLPANDQSAIQRLITICKDVR